MSNKVIALGLMLLVGAATVVVGNWTGPGLPWLATDLAGQIVYGAVSLGVITVGSACCALVLRSERLWASIVIITLGLYLGLMAGSGLLYGLSVRTANPIGTSEAVRGFMSDSGGFDTASSGYSWVFVNTASLGLKSGEEPGQQQEPEFFVLEPTVWELVVAALSAWGLGATLRKRSAPPSR